VKFLNINFMHILQARVVGPAGVVSCSLSQAGSNQQVLGCHLSACIGSCCFDCTVLILVALQLLSATNSFGCDVSEQLMPACLGVPGGACTGSLLTQPLPQAVA
jgi:hypothetical protein